MTRTTLAAVAALLLSTAAASAVTKPQIVGAYTLEWHDLCPNQVTATYGTGGTVDSLGINAGSTHQYLMQANFMSTGGLSFSGFKDGGNLVTVLNSGGGAQPGVVQGDPFTEQPQSGTSTFSNTATTLTLVGETFNVAYNNVDFRGIAHGFMWMGLFTNGAGQVCSEQGTAARVQ